jgi:WD40 repeat protein
LPTERVIPTLAEGEVLESSGVVSASDAGNLQKVAILNGHSQAVRGLAFTPDSAVLATSAGGDDKTIQFWEVASGDNQGVYALEAAAYRLAFAPDGKTLAAGLETGKILLLDVADVSAPQEVAALEGHAKAIAALAYSPDGSMLISATGAGEAQVRLWDAASGEELFALVEKGGLDPVIGVGFSPDGSQVSAAWGSGKIMIWNTAGGSEANTLPGASGPALAQSVAYLPDFSGVMWGGANGKLILQKFDGSDAVTSTDKHLQFIVTMGVSPDGTTFYSGGIDGSLKVWDSTQTAVESIDSLGTISAFSVSPDGKTLALALGDKTVVLWGIP